MSTQRDIELGLYTVEEDAARTHDRCVCCGEPEGFRHNTACGGIGTVRPWETGWPPEPPCGKAGCVLIAQHAGQCFVPPVLSGVGA